MRIYLQGYVWGRQAAVANMVHRNVGGVNDPSLGRYKIDTRERNTQFNLVKVRLSIPHVADRSNMNISGE